MPRTKNEILSIGSTAEVKTLLKLAAKQERRSASSMVEVLILDYARSHRRRPGPARAQEFHENQMSG